MTKSVCVADSSDSIVTKYSTATKVNMTDIDTTVNDVGIGSTSSAIVVEVVGKARITMRDAS